MKKVGNLEYLKQLKNKRDRQYNKIQDEIKRKEEQISKLKREVSELEDERYHASSSGINGHIARMRESGCDNYKIKGEAIIFYKGKREYMVDPDDYRKLIPKEA